MFAVYHKSFDEVFQGKGVWSAHYVDEGQNESFVELDV